MLSKTVLGRITVAIGSNEEAARLSGIDTRRWKLIIYVVGGLFTGVAGVVMAARLGSAQPQLGVGYELQAIAAVIIGGTSLMGGRGSIVGTLIGALIMSVLINGLRILSIQTEWQNVVLGVVIALAVVLRHPAQQAGRLTGPARDTHNHPATAPTRATGHPRRAMPGIEENRGTE